VLFKGIKLVILGIASLALVSQAMAQDATLAAPKFGFDYRAGLTYDDHGIEDYDGAADDPSATTNIDLEVARLSATGEAAKNVTYKFRYNLLSNKVEVGMVKLKHSDMISFSAGRMKVNQGGYNVKKEAYNNVSPGSEYNHSMPFEKYSDMFGLHFNLLGTLTVQILDDVQHERTTNDDGAVLSDNGFKNDKAKGPAMTVEWMGDFDGWKPLVQLSSYDLNKSMYFVLGVQGKAAGLGLSLDYIMDNRTNHQYADDGTTRTGEDAKNVLTGINAEVNYAMADFTPWVEYHSYANKQGDNKDAGMEDQEGNVAVATSMASESDYWDDNGTSISVGTNCNAMGQGYTPYLAVVQQSGKFLKADGETETLSNLMVKLGVFGAF